MNKAQLQTCRCVTPQNIVCIVWILNTSTLLYRMQVWEWCKGLWKCQITPSREGRLNKHSDIWLFFQISSKYCRDILNHLSMFGCHSYQTSLKCRLQIQLVTCDRDLNQSSNKGQLWLLSSPRCNCEQDAFYLVSKEQLMILSVKQIVLQYNRYYAVASHYYKKLFCENSDVRFFL